MALKIIGHPFVLADLETTAEFPFIYIPSTGKILWWHDWNGVCP